MWRRIQRLTGELEERLVRMMREVGEAGGRQHHERVAADRQQPQRAPQLGALLAHRDVFHFLRSFKKIMKVIVLVKC